MDSRGAQEGDKLNSTAQTQYEFLHLLGEGGCGQVWLANQSRITQKVTTTTKKAVKLIHPQLLNENGLAIFSNEVSVLATLSSTPYFVLGEPDEIEKGGTNHQAIVMPFIEGRGLDKIVSDHLAHNLLPPINLSALWLQRLSKALTMLHDLNLVHRDIKPENTLFGSSGQPMYCDVGTAAIHGKGIRGLETHFTGSLHNTPPEIFNFLAQGTVGTKEQDIYALGLMGYTLLSGVNPVRYIIEDYQRQRERLLGGGRVRIGKDSKGKVADKSTVVLRDSVIVRNNRLAAGPDMPHIPLDEFPKIVPLQEYCGDVPEELSRIIMQALSTEPSKRPGAGELTGKLSHYLYPDFLSRMTGTSVGIEDADSRDYLGWTSDLNRLNSGVKVTLNSGLGKLALGKYWKQIERGKDLETIRCEVERYRTEGVPVTDVRRTLSDIYGTKTLVEQVIKNPPVRPR